MKFPRHANSKASLVDLGMEYGYVPSPLTSLCSRLEGVEADPLRASSSSKGLHPSIGMYYGMALMFLYPEVGNLVLAYLSFETDHSSMGVQRRVRVSDVTM